MHLNHNAYVDLGGELKVKSWNSTKAAEKRLPGGILCYIE